DLLGSGTVNVSGSGVSLGLAGAANSTLVVDGPTVNFTGALRQATANLTVDGGTVKITSRLSAGVAGWAGNFSGGTVTIATGGGYGIRLGDDNFTFNGSGGNTGTGQLSATITQATGSTVTVGGAGVQIGSGSTAGTTATDTYTLNGGSLTTTNLQIAANGTSETAEFDLAGGTITVTNPTPTTANGNGLAFGTSLGSGSSAAFNFETGNGVLILKDASGTTPWTFATLTSIANSKFLVNGVAATSSELTFKADSTLAGYTDIALAPEPASLGLLAVGGMSLLLVRRKKAC
ncbi:MAG: PEP-CTERM sorting domain-containing protein, partial [Phycisphaerae bacterium]